MILVLQKCLDEPYLSNFTCLIDHMIDIEKNQKY